VKRATAPGSLPNIPILRTANNRKPACDGAQLLQQGLLHTFGHNLIICETQEKFVGCAIALYERRVRRE
jgi:hypothetical protein